MTFLSNKELASISDDEFVLEFLKATLGNMVRYAVIGWPSQKVTDFILPNASSAQPRTAFEMK